MKVKKAQEEIIGFVLIVLIVVIISIVLLGISLRSDSRTEDLLESEELNSFLTSVSSVTTECEIPKEEFQTIGDLVIKCYENEICENDVGKTACSVLDETLKEILERSTYIVDENSNNKYYNLEIYYEQNNATKNNIIPSIHKESQNVKLGECPEVKIYNINDFIAIDRQRIYMRLEVCYSN